MSRIVDFRVLSEDSGGDLAEEVRKLLAEGWTLGQFAAVWRPYLDGAIDSDGSLLLMHTMLKFEESSTLEALGTESEEASEKQ